MDFAPNLPEKYLIEYVKKKQRRRDTMETTKISVKARFAYGCGDLGCNIIYSAMSSFLLFYFTDYVKVSALTIGTIMLISRLFD